MAFLTCNLLHHGPFIRGLTQGKEPQREKIITKIIVTTREREMIICVSNVIYATTSTLPWNVHACSA